MVKTLKGAQTLDNLLKSFAGECQARGRYNLYAKRAEQDGFMQIASIFNETADNERVHGNQFYKSIIKYIDPGEILQHTIQAAYPVELGDTLQNLKAAAQGEHAEFIEYPQFGDTAEQEGFSDIAYIFRNIAKVESVHEQRYSDLADNVVNEMVFKKPTEVVWKCMKCGYHHIGTEAPACCPACGHPKAYFELYAKNY